jgi:hypothetical protein
LNAGTKRASANARAISSATATSGCPQRVRVALDPAFELGDRDEDELTRENDLELRLDSALEVVEADPD